MKLSVTSLVYLKQLIYFIDLVSSLNRFTLYYKHTIIKVSSRRDIETKIQPYMSVAPVVIQFIITVKSIAEQLLARLTNIQKKSPCEFRGRTGAPPFYRYKSWGYRPPLQSNLYRMGVHRFFLTPFSL